MKIRNWMLIGLLGAASSIYALNLVCAADPPPANPEKNFVAEDQPAPQFQPPRGGDRGPFVPADPSASPRAENNPYAQGRGPASPPVSPRSGRYGPQGMPGAPGMRGMMGGMGPMGPSDPEMEKLMQLDFSLDGQSHELAEQFSQASKDQRDEIKKKLDEVVTKQFEARQERRTLELKRLEDEIKRIRDSIDKRNQGKQQIVDRRVSELLGQDDTSF
jgi:hypothetical protein